MNGKNWVRQTNYIPYPGETTEESAQNHIDAILADIDTPDPPSLEDEIEQLKQENKLSKAKNTALTDRTDFHEDLITELAMKVYP